MDANLNGDGPAAVDGKPGEAVTSGHAADRGVARPINVQDVLETHPVGRMQWLIVVLCALLMFLDGFDTQIISYIAPVLVKEWGFPRDFLGTIFSAALVGLMIGYLAVSPLSMRYGHKLMLIVSSIHFAAFTLLTIFATNVTELIGLRVLTGIGLGAAAPSAVALVCEFAPKRLRATFVLLTYCGFSFGFVVAGFAAGALLPEYGWKSLMAVGAIGPLVLAIPLMIWLPESLSSIAQKPSADQRIHDVLSRLFPNAADIRTGGRFTLEDQDEQRGSIGGLFEAQVALGTFLLWSIFFINLSVFYFMQSWLPTMLAAINLPMSTVVWITALPTIAGILAALPAGLAMDRIGPYVTLAAMYLAGGLSLLGVAFAFLDQPWVLMVAIFCAGFCISGGQKSVIALAAIYYSRNMRSTGVGWALGIGRLGGIAGPLVVGMMYSARWTPEQIFQLAALPVFAAAAGVFLLGRLNRTRPAVPDSSVTVSPQEQLR